MTQSNKWAKLQEDLLKNNTLLAEITVENTTPVIFGGYNAKPYSAALGIIEDPRPTEIKGQWRWWSRALVSGALYNRGILIDISEANKIIAHVLGGKIGDELKPAKVSIEIQTINYRYKSFDPYNKGDRFTIAHIPRLYLLGQEILRVKRNRAGEIIDVQVKDPKVFKDPSIFYEKYSLYEHLKLNIRIFKTNIVKPVLKEYYEFALASLIISLLFSGIGAITSRAFGSLRIDLRNTKFYGEIQQSQTISSLVKSINKIYTIISKMKHVKNKENMGDDIEKELWSIIRLGISTAERYASRVEKAFSISSRVGSGNVLPSIPTATVGNNNVFRLHVITCKSNNPYDLLSSIGSSVLKQQIKTQHFNMRLRSSGANIHTFIIGLPRHSKIPYGSIQVITGYIVPTPNYRPTTTKVYSREKIQTPLSRIDRERTSSLRRVSTIGFTVLNIDPTIVLVYGMLSQDIDKVKHELIHRGVHGRIGRGGSINMIVDTPLNNVNVVDEFNRLWNGIISILRC